MYLIDLDPERRRRYRILLYTGLALLVALLAGGAWVLDRFFRPPAERVWTTEELAAHPDVELFRRYVRIDTSRETGSELAGAEFLAAELQSAGIPAEIETLGERRANLWAILEGDDPQAVVLHNHLDVYPVEDPEAWSHPPFGAEIDDVWLFGRGVFDMKSVTIAQLRAIQSLAASGERPRRSVIFLATSGEETGSDLGSRWILDRHPELVERFWAVLTEGGVVEPKTWEEIKYWGVEFAQKQFATLWACAADRERLDELREEILAWRDRHQRWRLTDEVARFFEAYGPSRDSRVIRDLLADPRATLTDATRFGELPEYLQAALRDEVVPFRPEADPEGGGFRLKILLHLLPGGDAAELRERLLPSWITHGVTLTAETPPLGAGGGSPLDHEAFTTTVEAIADAHPDATVGPYFLPWSATDSRFFRDAGIPSYGFSPFLIFNTDTFRVDAVDERIALPGFLSGVELYIEALRRLAG